MTTVVPADCAECARSGASPGLRLRGVLAAALAAGLVVPAFPATPASFTGSVVVQSEDALPLPGAVVHLADARTGEILASATTDPDGAFRADGLAPAAYRVGVESRGRLYAVSSPVTLAPGQVRSVTVAIPANAQTGPGVPPAESEADKGGITWWNNPLTASLIVVGGAVILGILIDQATDDDEPTPASPFSMQE